MTHHMPRGSDLLWTKDIKHVFLIRSPERVIASYREKMPSVSPDDIGIIRQRELFEEITALTGQRPPVVDSADILANPKAMMREICEALCVEWVDGCMTNWKQGARPSTLLPVGHAPVDPFDTECLANLTHHCFGIGKNIGTVDHWRSLSSQCCNLFEQLSLSDNTDVVRRHRRHFLAIGRNNAFG